MDKEERKAVLSELEYSNEGYEEEWKLPEWLRRSREKARKIFKEFDEKGYPVGRFGMDFDLLEYRPDISLEHRKRKSLRELEDDTKIEVEKTGQSIEDEEKYRAGSKFQEDADTTYLDLTEYGKRLLESFPDGLVVKEIEEAAREYPWIEKLWSHIHPMNLDKYTAYNAGFSRGGVFVWIKKGVKMEFPLQACFLLETQRLAQLPRILVVAEPYSKIHLISGCVVQPRCEAGLHGCITEIYAGEGSETTYSMIHNFRENFHIRPKIGAVIDRNATYIENFIIIAPCLSDQAYPTAVLRGDNSRAVIRTIVLGLKSSDIDVGSALIFSGENTRGELISRTVATDKSNVKMRGTMKGYESNVKGHLECRGMLLSETARARAYPQLRSTSPDANLTHEAAIGKIAEEDLYYLMSRKIKEEDATSIIVRGFLDVETPGFPPLLRHEINRVVSMSLEEKVL